LHYAREALIGGSLGFADMVLVSIPPPAVLRNRKGVNATRQRRLFDLHARLAEPLREWYSAVERAEPGRVVWSWPTTGVPVIRTERTQRRDTALLDSVIAHLPEHGQV
jgi:hypothetical protein